MGMLSLHCFPAPLSPRAEGWQTLLPKDNKSKQTTKTAKKNLFHIMKLTMLIKWDSSALEYASTTQKQDFYPPSDL